VFVCMLLFYLTFADFLKSSHMNIPADI